MNRTTLVAAIALGLGLLLAGGGSVVLAHARAAVRADHPRRRGITQYPAALSALLGFLLTSVAGAVLCWRLAPGGGATAVLAAIVAGVILFALVGALFARVADRVEERQLRQVPQEVHRPISAPPRRPALTAAPAVGSGVLERRAVGSADHPALSPGHGHHAAPSAAPGAPIGTGTGEPPAPYTYAATREPSEPRSGPSGPSEPLALGSAEHPTIGSAEHPTIGSAEHPTIGSAEYSTIGSAEYSTIAPAEGRPSEQPFDAEPRAVPRPRTPSDPPPFGYSTPLIPVPPRETATAPAAQPHRAEPVGAATPPADAAEPPDVAPDAPLTSTTRDDTPTPAAEATVEAAPEPALVPGWMYHDEADSWFLAVGTPGGIPALLGLPAFALVVPGGAGAPIGTLRRAGAAELTVLPEEFPTPDPALTEENDVSDVVADTPSNSATEPRNTPSDPGKGEAG